MASHRLKTLTVGVVTTLILSWAGPVPPVDRAWPAWPSRAEPLRVDSINKRVLIYAEVNPKSLNQSTPHWGVVFQGGKLNDKAIFHAFCTPQEFHNALLQINARPGNNLTLCSSGEVIGGDELLVSVIGPGLSRPLGLADILEDSSGKGFRIRFGGNRQRALEEQTGCITCLESCPVGITSNAAHPALSSFKRLLSPNSEFKGKTEKFPRKGGLILIYSFAFGNRLLLLGRGTVENTGGSLSGCGSVIASGQTPGLFVRSKGEWTYNSLKIAAISLIVIPAALLSGNPAFS
jgi:hypothetical protein